MSYEYIRDSAGDLLHDKLDQETAYAYNTDKLGVNGTFGRKNYQEIVLWRYFWQAVMKLNPWLTKARDRLLPKLMSGEIEV